MGLFSNFLKNDTTINLYSNQAFKVLGNFFGFNNGSVKMAELIEAYGTNPIVFSIINLIAGVCDGTEKVLLDGETEIERSDVLDVLNALNEHELYTNLLASGNAFLRYIKGVGMGAEYEVLNSKCVEIVLNSNGTIRGYKYSIGNTEENISEEDILHIKFSNIIHTDVNRMHYGYSPLEAGMKIVTASSAIFEAEAAIFKNRGVIGLLSNDSNELMLPKDKKAIQESLDKELGGAHQFNKVNVTNANVKYVQMGMSPTDLQLIDNQISKLRFLCSLYGIDSKLLGDGSNSTYNNVKEAQKNAYTNTYLPLMKRVNKAIIKDLNKRQGTNYSYEVNLTKIEALKETNTLEQLLIEKIQERDLELEDLQRIQLGQILGENNIDNEGI